MAPSNAFESTEWSLVLAASTQGGPALDRLCRAYWRPIYVYIRASGVPASDAEDATQEFFADMLRRDWLKLVDQDRGSFRGFLHHSVRLFLNNRRRQALAQKRGGGASTIPIDTEEGERELGRRAAGRTDPAGLYDQSWADCVIEAALARLATEQTKAGNGTFFQHLRAFLTCPPVPGEYARLADDLRVPPGQIALRVHRLTQRFAEVIRAEVAATLADRSDVETELRHLVQLVSRQS